MNSRSPRVPRIVILASGFSTRLGRPKALVTIRGQSVLMRLSRAITPVSRAPLSIVVAPRSATHRAALRLGMLCIENPARHRGMSAAVRCALQAATYAPAVLLLPVDLVALRPASIHRMLNCWRGQRRKVIARRLDGRGVSPVLLPRHLFRAADLLQGDSGLRHWLATLTSAQLTLMDLPDAAPDLDTPQDLLRLRRNFRR